MIYPKPNVTFHLVGWGNNGFLSGIKIWFVQLLQENHFYNILVFLECDVKNPKKFKFKNSNAYFCKFDVQTQFYPKISQQQWKINQIFNIQILDNGKYLIYIPVEAG